MRWFKRGYVSIVETLISNAVIGCPQWPKSAPTFSSAAEQELLMEGYGEFQNLIKTTGNTSKAAKARREGWQKVADKLNA